MGASRRVRAGATPAPPAGPYAAAREAAAVLRPRLPEAPRVAIVLGTGLGGLADRLEEAQAFPYAELPHFPRSTVLGHAGRLVVGRLAGVPVAALQGRFHLYEGYTPAQVVHPVRVLGLLGARTLIVTNASGGLDPALRAGDLLLLRDHIGLASLAGQNPLVGPNDEDFGPRFPPMTAAYDPELRALARAVAAEQGDALPEGVYVMVSGPTFETPAELAFLRRAGADAVGMSTVPEVIAARHMGLRVLALSCVTNIALPPAGEAAPVPSHAEVVAAAEAAGERLARLVAGVVARLGDGQPPRGEGQPVT
jgi:purine-nucleoside phosphorylase